MLLYHIDIVLALIPTALISPLWGDFGRALRGPSAAPSQGAGSGAASHLGSHTSPFPIREPDMALSSPQLQAARRPSACDKCAAAPVPAS